MDVAEAEALRDLARQVEETQKKFHPDESWSGALRVVAQELNASADQHLRSSRPRLELVR